MRTRMAARRSGVVVRRLARRVAWRKRRAGAPTLGRSGKRRRFTDDRTYGKATLHKTRGASRLISTSIKQVAFSNISSLWLPTTTITSDAVHVRDRTVRIYPIAPPTAGTVAGSEVACRAVEDSNSKYLGCKIQMKFTNQDPDKPWNIRYTVVELKERDTFVKTYTDAFALDEFEKNFWKQMGHDEQLDASKGLTQVSFLNMRHCKHNTNDYNILKQGYINFTPTSSTMSWQDRDINFYIPMRRILSKDEKGNIPFPGAKGTTIINSCYSMRKPVFLVVELMPPNFNITGTEDELVRISYFAKHYWKSG